MSAPRGSTNSVSEIAAILEPRLVGAYNVILPDSKAKSRVTQH